MPNREQSALLVHRENYEVPKGQEHSVHIKIAKVTKDGTFIEAPRIIREAPKFFETVAKRNLEALGYTVEILYHPMDRYSSVRIESKEAQLQAVRAEMEALKTEGQTALSEKDAEIARLKAELAKMKEAKPEAEAAPKKESKKKEK